jgi:hypothetical protein
MADSLLGRSSISDQLNQTPFVKKIAEADGTERSHPASMEGLGCLARRYSHHGWRIGRRSDADCSY